MAEAARDDAWSRTSMVLAMMFNANRDPKRTRARKPEDFMPKRSGGRADGGDIEIPITALRDVFIDGKIPEQYLEH